jgi:hypothetical protein
VDFLGGFDCFRDRFGVMLLSGLGGVFTAAFSDAMKRRCASSSAYWSSFLEGAFMSRLTEEQLKVQRRKAYELHLLPEHLMAIGHVAIRAAMLDKLIEMTAAQITRHYLPTVQKHLEELTTPAQLELIKDDLTRVMPDHKNAIAEFASEVKSARYERNDIIHGLWRATETPEIKAIVNITHNTPEKEKRRVTDKSMMRLANQLLDLAIELGDWKMAFNTAHPQQSASSPGMPQPPIWNATPPRRSARDPQKTL